MTRIERQCLPETTIEQMMADLPRLCDKGCKNDSKGLPSYWIGYKLHLDTAGLAELCPQWPLHRRIAPHRGT
jgi:hypothetical protein